MFYPFSFSWSSSMVEMTKVQVEMRTIVNEKKAMNLIIKKKMYDI